MRTLAVFEAEGVIGMLADKRPGREGSKASRRFRRASEGAARHLAGICAAPQQRCIEKTPGPAGPATRLRRATAGRAQRRTPPLAAESRLIVAWRPLIDLHQSESRLRERFRKGRSFSPTTAVGGHLRLKSMPRPARSTPWNVNALRWKPARCPRAAVKRPSRHRLRWRRMIQPMQSTAMRAATAAGR